MFERAVSKQLLEDLSYFPVVGILGPRQVGKTTLVKWLQKKLDGPSLYLDLELDTDRRRLDDAETFLKSQSNKCIILDEIQLRPTLFQLIRALVDIDRRPARFIILGSASPELIRGTSESLAGRIAYTELAPLSLSEVHLQVPMADHWLKGGFPEALLAPKTTLSFRWLGSFFQTFIYRDLQALGYGINNETAGKLLTMLSYLNGSLINMNDLSRSIGVTSPTINRYLDLLEGSFIIRRLQPYHANVSKRLVKTAKVYFRDSGLLHYLSHIQSYEQLQHNPLVGASWEGYVIEQILRSLSTDWQTYFYRTQVGAETDLVLISPNGQKICIEIKLSNSPTVSKGFYECLKDIQPDLQFILIPSETGYVKSEGLRVCNLQEFLLQILPEIQSF
jgi:predicted AAA+ superfamily ATPase